jgi:hypothetical protein
MMAEESGVRAELERVAAGLLYTSEGDYPFDVVYWAGADAASLSPAGFAALAGRAGETVQEVSLDQFLARHIERVDPADSVSVALVPRYQALKDALRAGLPQLHVFRIGGSEIDCWVVGSAEGGIAGVHTKSLET